MKISDIQKRYLFYTRKKIKNKIIIIESDDWGLERASNAETLNWMKKKYGEENFSRWSLDSLETPDDLSQLFELLNSYKNKFSSAPVITANFITHNVDYEKKDRLEFRSLSSGFSISRDTVELTNLYKEGISEKIIYPQLHGFSHYNLSEAEKYFETEEGKEAFDKGFFAARATIRKNLSFLQGEMSVKNYKSDKLNEAVCEFQNYFGFKSVSFIPPTFIFDLQLKNLLTKNGIELVQSANRITDSTKNKIIFPYLNEKNGLFWSVRNARLDPHPDYKMYSDQCLSSIERAFDDKLPAIIDFHRVNFSGRFAPEYRDRTLRELKILFDEIYKKWPDVKFMHSGELNELLWQREIR